MHGGRELVLDPGEAVDRDRVNGTINEIAGRAKRQVAEWTGDKDKEIEGLAQELKGKAQKAWGSAKGAVRAAQNEAKKGEKNQGQTSRRTERSSLSR